jgi:hypothetical protein
VIKGILDPADAVTARGAGADGVIVSNHGGRQLDGAVAALRVLPGIVAACPDIPVMIDGGVRRGTDVLKALALGARCAFVGRPFGYAAAIAGAAGVNHAIGLLSAEIDRDMAMLGVPDLRELGPARVAGGNGTIDQHCNPARTSMTVKAKRMDRSGLLFTVRARNAWIRSADALTRAFLTSMRMKRRVAVSMARRRFCAGWDLSTSPLTQLSAWRARYSPRDLAAMAARFPAVRWTLAARTRQTGYCSHRRPRRGGRDGAGAVV